MEKVKTVEIIVSVVSGFAAGLISGFASSYNSDRKIKIENVTLERAKWREKMRNLAKDLVRLSQCYEKNRKEQMVCLCAELETRLNPNDKEDRDLLASARELIPVRFKLRNDGLERKIDEFSKRMGLLLKHDWERAKFESAPWWSFETRPHRIKYCDFLKTQSEDCEVKSCLDKLEKFLRKVAALLRGVIAVALCVAILLLAVSMVLISSKFLMGL